MEYVEFFENKIRRKMQLVNLLTEKECSATELTACIPKTFKTIKADINELKIELDSISFEGVNLLRNENRYRLVGLDAKSKHVLILSYIEDSVELPMYQFLLDPKKKLSIFLKSIYMSHSQFRSRYPRVEELCVSYGFHLPSISSHLSGCEINIRFFFLQFYWEVFRGIKWPFQEVSEKIIEEKIVDIQRVSGHILSTFEKKKCAYFFAICEIRKEKDSQISIPKIIKQLLESPLYDSVRTVCASITKEKESSNGTEIILLLTLYLFPLLGCDIHDQKNQVEHRVFSMKTTLHQNKFTIKKWVETTLLISNRELFYVYLLQLILFEKIYPFLLLKDELKKFYLCFIGKNDWEYEEKKISANNGKDFDVCNWVISHMLINKVKIYINSMYGEQAEEMIRSQVFLGEDKRIDWVATDQEITDQTLVITDQLFSLGKFKKEYYVSWPLTRKEIYECQEYYRKMLD